jgi:hypothetical protein
MVRSIPRGNWARAGALALSITIVFTGVWEMRVRAMGYAPSLNDSSDLWASWRSRLAQSPDQTVIIGSSRIHFDFDLKTYADYFGTERPIQLAMPGTNPMELLESAAVEESFRGTLILGVTPALWFVPEGMPVDNARRAVARFVNWSPSQRAGLVLSKPLQKSFAFINQEDLTLNVLIRRVQLSNRPGAQQNIPPVIPSYFASLDDYRQARMWDQCDFGTALAEKIQQIWIPLFTPPPPPPHLSEEEFGEMMQANMQSHLERMRVAVTAVRERGGRIVLVRPPSTSILRDLEHKFAPREAFYDRMLAVTNAPGIHFEDHPELASFDCPEWSHLTAEDAVKFTTALMPLLEQALATGP